MSAHLSHKLHWDWLVDYFTPFVDHGITLPVGDCNRIHASQKKHAIQVEMRNYISDSMLCTAKDCETTGQRLFRKSDKKSRPFGIGTRDKKKLEMFMRNLADTIHEFAATELRSPVKSVECDPSTGSESFVSCEKCSEFIHRLEFGDKQKLFEYKESELRDIFGCVHGSQAVGNSMTYIFYHVLEFYVYSNVIVYLDLRNADQWPEFMRPDSYCRSHLMHACDGQTFLPYSRKFLPKAMIDANETRELSKRLFRFLYFFVMMKMRLNGSYKLHEDPNFSLAGRL